jgi:protein arginine N-methyltransferase 3
MSVHLPPTEEFISTDDADATSSEEDDDDQNWDDWVSDDAEQPCRSLFDDKLLPSAREALAHDKSVHDFDLENAFARLCK